MASARDSLKDRIGNSIALGALALLPVWITLAHRAVAPTVLLLGLIAATRPELWRDAARFLKNAGWRDPLMLAVGAFLAFCVWAAISGIWAPRADAPRLGLNILAPAAAGTAAVWDIARRREMLSPIFRRVLAGAAVATIALLTLEAATGGWLRSVTWPTDESQGRIKDMISLGRGATVLAAMAFGALLLVWRMSGRRLLVAALFAATVFAAYRFHIFANVGGLIFGAIVFAAALYQPKATVIALAALIVALLAAAPAAALAPADHLVSAYAGTVPISWLQRLLIWRFAAENAIGCLPFGCGADYARALRESGGEIFLPGWNLPVSQMPVHPHNLFLQIWLEFGLPGVILFAVFIGAAAQAIVRSTLAPAVVAAIAATVACTLVSALVEMSLWQVWRIAAPALGGVYIAAAMSLPARTPAGS